MTSPSEPRQAQFFPIPKAAEIVPAYITHADALQFCQWLKEQDVTVHEGVFPVSVQLGLYSLTRGDLRWLCKAILQAGDAPSVDRMRKAILSRDVGDLR